MMRAIELFAGAGGLGMGVSAAGFKPALIVERDRWCCDTIRMNQRMRTSAVGRWPKPHQGDVRKIDFRPYEGHVALVSGGPPCQPFSQAGRHAAHDDHRDMWSEAVRAVREARPKAFIFENVKGLARRSFSDYLGYILLQLQHPSLARRKDEIWADHHARLQRHHTSRTRPEYRVVHALLNAANYGVPQKRERVVFVGFAEGIDACWSFPPETHSLESLLWSQFGSNEYWERHGISKRSRAISPRMEATGKRIDQSSPLLPWRTVRDALVGLPDPEADKEEASVFLNHRFQPGARSYPGHTGSFLDEPAKTLKAGVHGVPGGENMLRRANGKVRYFSVRESARLQEFPDDYELHGSWSEAMRQLGNAVPVTLGEIVAKSVRKQLVAT